MRTRLIRGFQPDQVGLEDFQERLRRALPAAEGSASLVLRCGGRNEGEVDINVRLVLGALMPMVEASQVCVGGVVVSPMLPG